jgi:ATP-dependent DNA helicase RecG
VKYHDNSGKIFTEKNFTGPIHQQLRNVLSYIKTHFIEEKVIKASSRAEAERVFNYPLTAIEEVIANAFYHRSYEVDNPIEINIFPDRIEVLSFPGPLPPVDNNMLKQRRIIARNYRNRRVGDFFKELKLTEGRSTGFPTIYDSMEENGSPIPIFQTNDNYEYFLAILKAHPSFIQEDKKITKQEQMILLFCKKPQKRKDILNKLGLSNHPVNYARYLVPLIKKGWIDYTLPDVPTSPKQKYVITKKGSSILR